MRSSSTIGILLLILFTICTPVCADIGYTSDPQMQAGDFSATVTESTTFPVDTNRTFQCTGEDADTFYDDPETVYDNVRAIWGFGAGVTTPANTTWTYTESYMGSTSVGCMWNFPNNGNVSVTVQVDDEGRFGESSKDSSAPISLSNIDLIVVGADSIDGPDVVGVGKTATFTATTNPTGYNQFLNWGGDDSASQSGSGTYTPSWSTGGTKTIWVKCSPRARGANPAPSDLVEKIVTVVAVDLSAASDTVCVDSTCAKHKTALTVTVTPGVPAGSCNVEYSVAGGVSIVDGSGNPVTGAVPLETQVYAQGAAVGEATVTATVTSDSVEVGSDGVTIKIKMHPPTCSGDTDCSDSSGSGGCSSCSGSDVPTPGMKTADVKQGPVAGGSPGGSFEDSGQNTCGALTVESYDTCDGIYLRVISPCGKCYMFDLTHGSQFSRVPVIPDYRNGRNVYAYVNEDGSQSFSFTVDFGATVSGTLLADGSVDCTWTNAEESYIDYSVGAPSASGGWKLRKGPDTMTAANGLQTSVTYGDTYDDVSTPDGKIWRYEHASGSKKITKIQQQNAADATSTDITYIETGAAAGKTQCVEVKDGNDDVLSHMDYTYYPDGKLESVTTNDKLLTLYEYDTDDNKITVTQKSANNPNEIYSKTEYHYGRASESGSGQPGQYETWVTRESLTNPAKDQKTVYVYDHDAQEIRTDLDSVTDPSGVTTSYTYNSASQPTNVSVTKDTTSLGSTHYDYSYPNGAVTQVTHTTSDDVSYYEYNTYYTGGIYLKTTEDIRGNFTYYARDPNGLWRVTAVKVSPPITGRDMTLDASWSDIPAITEYEYYGASETYGMLDQLKTKTVPDVDGTNDQVTSYKYLQGSVKLPSPTEVTYYDADGDPQTSTTEYDDLGRVLSTTDADSRIIWYRYDALGRQIYTVYKWEDDEVDGTPEVYTQNSYTCCGLEWSQDENGHKTYYDYDDANRVIDTYTDVSGQSSTYPLVAYEYDKFGNQTKVTTRSGSGTGDVRETSYTYDDLNRVVKIVYPCDTNEGDLLWNEYYEYDDSGNMVAKLVGLVNGSDEITAGKVTAYGYDTHNRLVSVKYDYCYGMSSPTWPLELPLSISNEDVAYTYENHTSLKTSMTDSSGESSYTYDSRGRLKTYTPPLGLDTGYYVWYDYNVLGQKTAVKIRDDDSPTPNVTYDVSYDYFPNGWLEDVKSGTTTIASYEYDILGNRARQVNGNGTYTDYAYNSTDPRYLLDSMTHYKMLGSSPSPGTDTSLSEIEYPTRDDAGNPLGMSDWTGTWTYDYDANNRLITADPPNPVPDQPAGGPYTYDWVGNRLNPPTSTNHMVYNKADQLVKWPGMHGDSSHAGYVYNYDGSLHEVYNAKSTPDQIADYTYTEDGLLDTATYGNSRTLTNTWDADRNRVRADMNGTTWDYIYDPTAGIPAVIEEKTGSTPNYYIREPDGSLLARQRETTVYYYHFDQLGSTRMLTDGSGTVTDKYAYDAYGALISHVRSSGSVDQPYQYVGQLGYYTHWQEPDFGLLQLGMRFYDAEIGRFTQEDPAGHGHNWYAYCGGIPVNAVDPTGLFYSRERCLRLLDDINRISKSLNDHWCKKEVQENGGFDPGHMKELMPQWLKQEELREKYLQNCTDRKPKMPALPAPVPKPVPAPARKPQPVKICIPRCVPEAVAVIGTGYIIYRCVRMIPSLAIPFLWPTIPANALCPI